MGGGVPLGLGCVDVDVEPARDVSSELGVKFVAERSEVTGNRPPGVGKGEGCWRSGREETYQVL